MDKKKENQDIEKTDKQSLKDHAINKKGDVSDGNKINPQVEQRKDIHQPRDNA
ncbi:hypothetical protein [Gelidibacter mesophilus]|uniref:hypothetical protein n=1 Tax=Gelidibacter mesophilus TaxID=169050 RepID=UPI000403434C|nr:hypothetical protein [Gelidibacter mesophilus]